MHNFLTSFKARNHLPHIVEQHPVSHDRVTSPLLVVELFQSQGCSSCPPANDNLLKLVHDPNLLVLTYDVTYWDHLGWKDTFGNGDFDRRQWAYARALRRKNVFTPQVIVNGHIAGVGSTTKDLQSLIQAAKSLETRSDLEIRYDIHTKAVHVSGPVDQYGIVNLIQYDPELMTIPIGRGENRGRTLAHANVVQRVISLGRWNGGKQEFTLPVPVDDSLSTAILVQQANEAGRILDAVRL